MRASPLKAWALLVSLLAAPFAGATIVVAQSIEQMSASAQLIVHGVVGQVQSRWDDAHRRILTYAEVKVLEGLKGGARGLVLVRQPGGIVGELGHHVSGVARFSPGEEVVLFLEAAPDEAGAFNVYGLSAGKVRFETAPSGQTMAVRDLSGVAFAGPGRGKVWSLGARDELGPAMSFLSQLRKWSRR